MVAGRRHDVGGRSKSAKGLSVMNVSPKLTYPPHDENVLDFAQLKYKN
jgi:Golgi nucleoside diphosphatase